MREEASRDVKGDVLEVAVGTGLQLDYLRNNHNIESIIGIDKSDGMLSEARKRLALLQSSEFPVELSMMDAAAMTELPNDTFDTVQSTFSFCVFNEPQRVMQEMRRVVKPEGHILVLENSRSTFRPLALFQDITEPIITPYSKGCRWNVDVPGIADKAGLTLERSKSAQAGTIFSGVYTK
jgi:ubiquinone/menaquinone biosynthesis C-methylase UbiE